MNGFVAAVSIVFGVLAWAQLPAVCGFMLSSTLAGAENYVYSLWLGTLIAAIGVVAATRSMLQAPRHPLLVAGFALNAAFILCAVFAHARYGDACRAIYSFFTPG